MLIWDVVGPITHQGVQTNYQTSLTCVIQLVRPDWCLRGATAPKKKKITINNCNDKYFSQIVLSVHKRRNMLSNNKNIMKKYKSSLIHKLYQ